MCRLLTLFTRVLPLDVAARVWDAFLVLDEVFLMQTALGLLKSLHDQLIAGDIGDCLQLTKQIPADTDPELLFQGLCSVEVSKRQYYELVAMETPAKSSGAAASLKHSNSKPTPRKPFSSLLLVPSACVLLHSELCVFAPCSTIPVSKRSHSQHVQ